MLENQVLELLRKYLGEYVEGLSLEALQISVWKGNVVLKDLRLKAEALNSLRLPITVKAGFIGSITLKVPWKSLGKEPVVVLIDRVFILAHPAPDGFTLKEENKESLFEAKLRQIEEAELATLEAASRRSKAGSASGGNSWLTSFISTIIGNLKVSLSNIHIRYEDSVTNTGHPFCSGVTLFKLAAVTTDEQGNETFDTSGVLDNLRKSMQLQRLAIYHDPDSSPWKPKKEWKDLSPAEWTEIFLDGIGELSRDMDDSNWARNHNYLVSPINGVLNYHRWGKQERKDPEMPLERASLLLSDVSLTVSEAQYYDGIKLLETFSRYRTRIEMSHLRPVLQVHEDPRAWWHYAVLASLQQKKLCYWFSWERIKHLCQLRRHYVQLYAALLQEVINLDTSELRQIEKVLDSKVIVLWRLLARAKLESVKSKKASQKKALKKSWWSFGWHASAEVSAAANDPSLTPLVEEQGLAKEEWQAINKLLSYQQDENTIIMSGKDAHNSLLFLVDVSIRQAAARIIDINDTEIACGRFEQLQVSTKLYNKSVFCDLSLRYCGLSSPEGLLAQSVSSERKSNALIASLVHAPTNEDVDWRLSATIAPCHVTVLLESYERLLGFLQRSKAVSPTVASETATALQMKIEQVTRRAQEQIQMVLEEQCRFALDIDLDAPKVRVPVKTHDCSPVHFLLDFGHFTLHTREGGGDERRQSLYSRFYITGREIAALFIDEPISSEQEPTGLQMNDNLVKEDDGFHPLIDRCGISVILDQIKIPHPDFPSSRVTFQVPNLVVHFSPARYCRVVELLDMIYGSAEIEVQNTISSQNVSTPWHPPDLATHAKVLVWRGFGNSSAEWQHCFLVLSGLYLYVLESNASPTYQRCCSMAGRHVFEVAPTSVGGSLHALAVSRRGMDTQKALESSHTLIAEFRDDEERSTWLRELVQATYMASAPPSFDVLGESSDNGLESGAMPISNLRNADLVVNGTLVEMKLLLYGKLNKQRKSNEEALLSEVVAGGGKVNLTQFGGDLTVKTKLHSLKIFDQLQSCRLESPQFLAYSVLIENFEVPGSCNMELDEEMQRFFLKEDEGFTDALPEFVSTPDRCFLSQNPDLVASLSDSGEQVPGIGYVDVIANDKDPLKVKPSEVFYEARDSSISDFVSVTFLTRSPDSPLYDGIDTQMNIRMSKLEFFCNRPTIVSLIDLGLDLSSIVAVTEIQNGVHSPAKDSKDRDSKDNKERTLIKGLLGYGKARVVFNLRMDVDSVCIYLNKEDGTQLALFAQESFLLDVKVHPSSTTIEGTLGNMRLRDMSLGDDNPWSLLCDTRNQGSESLIKFTFQSYSVDDEDYQGFDYSLRGRLSAVRIVFLYRFVQEITSYFMDLASPHTEEAIKLVDKVGGLEWLIQKSEIDGAAAVNLDLSLDTPIIVVPRNTISKDYIQLDLGQLEVHNSFNWYGCEKNDPATVHLDVIHAEIRGINMVVGVNGTLGNPLIRDGRGLHIIIRRSLRDVFRKVPTLSIDVKVGVLHCVMSDKEYNVIVDCAYMNLSEAPNIPPSCRDGDSGVKNSMRMLAEMVNFNSQILLSRTVIIAVDIHYALLELCNRLDEASSLAQISLEGLWVSYRTTSLLEADLYVTIPKFTVLDVRPDTKPEMRLMLGSHADASKPREPNISDSPGRLESLVKDGSLQDLGDKAESNLTMLILDYRWRSSFQSAVIRIQQPRVLVVLDFILAVVEFFVPSLGALTGREEVMDPKNDPLKCCADIFLSDSVYRQTDEVVYFSPRRQLIVDGYGIDEFTYDGCGKTISLSEELEGKTESSSGAIVIIGRGKKLRFKNVKIENAALLRKCTYLSNGSRYTVSAEDAVEISLIENSTFNLDKDGPRRSQVCVTLEGDNNEACARKQCQENSFTFEAQVVSPEFTFYDSSKLSYDESVQMERLLRVKMDLSFMYASKENDAWVRSLVKDLTIEAGSGLVILEPMDFSGAYTSVKDKTNISATCTDICLNLSIAAVSLILQLQNQISSALQLSCADPLACCTNFEKLWICRKGDLPGYNLTFWRPQAPSNYAILGDCVTSRAEPPSQAVIAISNTYGRVRKPLGYKLVGLFSDFQQVEEGSKMNVNDDCSIWRPIPPPGYVAIGCVVNIGMESPPNHIVYCLRSDLVASTSFSECIFYVPPRPRIPSGFSIWRADNVLSSFYAHAAVDCPLKVHSFDLHQILLRHPEWKIPSSNNTKSNASIEKNQQESDDQSSSSSGWDILRTSVKTSSLYVATPHFERIWWDKGSDLRRPISIWRPLPRPGFAVLGDCIAEGLEPPAFGLIFRCDNSTAAAKPVQFTKVASTSIKGLDEAYFWYPVPPPGYVSMGCIVTKTDEVPRTDLVCCPRLDLVNQVNVSEDPVSRSSNSKGTNCWSIWKVDNQVSTFLARSDHKRPSSRLAYGISDHVKPITRDNVSAEMKLGRLSVSILDSYRGMMTPLFDSTITNINLATHGRLQNMSAVLICSVAASTFNRQLEAWEPLVEPFDGIFKFETYEVNELFQMKVGKRLRVAATSSLNVNVSAANLENLVESVLSWRRQIDLEKKASRRSEDAREILRTKQGLTFSALEEDDFQKITIENQLGCDLYLKRVEQISDDIELLQHNKETAVLIPPPSFSDRLNVVDRSRETRYYVAIHIFELKGLPVIDDGNGHEYFCALRLLIDRKASDQYKLYPQSARTRCVKPSNSNIADGVGYAKWNELFIFEVPKNGLATLEVEVTNLASKAGKGEVTGALSIPIGSGANILKRATSVRILQQTANVHHRTSYSLRKKSVQGQFITDKGRTNCGSLVMSTTTFERKFDANFEGLLDGMPNTSGDIGFWIGLGPDGPWESFASLLPLSVVPKFLDQQPFAFDVVLRSGKKHAILRALAVIVNETDVNFEVSVYSATRLVDPLLMTGTGNQSVVTEEIFENQIYEPVSGWGSKPTLQSCYPERWSTRDFSNSSKDFFESPLPSGWRWISAWSIEKSPLVDSEGWAYGKDFQSLSWPPFPSKSSSRSPQDFVRRRRWVRRRKQATETSIDSMRTIISVIRPGSSAVLPWRTLVSSEEMCLQFRPCAEYGGDEYSWGQTVILGAAKDHPSQQGQNLKKDGAKHAMPWKSSDLRVSQLEKKDLLYYCSSTLSAKAHFWFNVGTDASVLHTELNDPVYDWKLSISSPLKLENKLPYHAEYTIWEKNGDGNMVERQHGVVSSGGSSFIKSADLRRPIYLTLFVQGGWVLEKDAILIMDMVSLKHASSFWMIQKQNKRRLRVSLEYDMGSTDAAPKTIRFFVPYWISNDSTVPLAYRIVEVEPLENTETDSQLIHKAVKSAKFTVRNSSKSLDRKNYILKKNIQILDAIEDFNQDCVMFSPQDYASRNSVVSFPSRSDTVFTTRIGVSVAVHHSGHYSPGVSLFELESKERIDVKAFASDESYYKLSAQLNMASDRTKVIRFLPKSLFINRIGLSLCLCHFGSDMLEWLHPSDPPKLLRWDSSSRTELLKLRLDGYKWSSSFSVDNDGPMCISIKNEKGNEMINLRVEVRAGTKTSRYEVVFSYISLSSPYRIENHSMFLPVQFRQVDGNDDSWRSLPPNAAAFFFWEDLGRRRLLEILVDGEDPSTSMKYNIDEVMDHQPMQQARTGPTKALRVTVLREGKTLVARISDWMPDIDTLENMHGKLPPPVFHPSGLEYKPSNFASDSELHVAFELSELGLSIVDHMPEEILYLSVQNLLVSYSAGLGSGITRFKLRLQGIQVDNQLPFTPMPVLFRPQRPGDELEHVLKFSATMQDNGSLDCCLYPYIGLQVPENFAFLVNIHEPIIWRLHDMFQQVKFSRIMRESTNAVSVDPVIQIGLFNISEIRFRVSMAMSPTQRPKGVLGFWSSLMTALGNTEQMPVRINQRFHESICMRQSALISSAISNIQKDLLSQPLQLLSGVDILGNASSALGHMSKGVAALSMDKKFIQSRQKQDSKGVEDIGDVIREGGGALAKGFFRGVTGILTKPLEGAKSSGVEGFVQGVGKGIIGAAAQPVSGVLDLLSKTTEGANAVRMKITSAITSEEQLLRRRLPRAISGDDLLRPYDEFKATGQAILQLAESGAFLRQVDLFKVRGKFALSDAYEDHFLLPKGRILLVTHRRVLLLQQPTIIMAQRKFNPARDPCSVVWEVDWDSLLTMELTHGKKDHPESPPSRLILYLQARSNDSRENTRVVKCSRGSQQANQIFYSIQRALDTYGPSASRITQKDKVSRPYAPHGSSIFSDALPYESYGLWDVDNSPTLVSINSTFGIVPNQSGLSEKNIDA